MGSSPEVRSSDVTAHCLVVKDVLGEHLPPANVIDFAFETYHKAVHWFMLLFYAPSVRAELEGVCLSGHIRSERVNFLYMSALIIGIGAKYATIAEAERRCPGHDLNALGTKYISLVEARFWDVVDAGGIEVVQIAVMLSAFYLYHSRPKRSAALSGSALKTAQSLGLHKESGWKMSDPVTREVWRRLWWALHTADMYVMYVDS